MLGKRPCEAARVERATTMRCGVARALRRGAWQWRDCRSSWSLLSDTKSSDPSSITDAPGRYAAAKRSAAAGCWEGVGNIISSNLRASTALLNCLSLPCRSASAI